LLAFSCFARHPWHLLALNKGRRLKGASERRELRLDGISRGNKRMQKQLMLSLKTKAILILLFTLFPIYIYRVIIYVQNRRQNNY